MTQQDKQGRVGACKGFSYNSAEQVLMGNRTMYEVDSNTILLFFQCGKVFYLLKILHSLNPELFNTSLHL
jgi:hypothetical protein